jgi:anti-sigma-K factor RskA
MKHEHINSILEETPLSSLNEAELTAVRARASECQDCQRVYEAAYVSASLLKEHAAEAFEPPPFFQTRVLAALRERQGASEVWSLDRMWRSAGALVSSMAATVAILAGLSFIVPGTDASLDNVSASSYSAEELIFNQGELADDQVSDGQIMNTLYDADEDARK